MNTPANPVTPPTHAPSAADPTTAAAVASTHTHGGEVNSNTKINSLKDLKEKAPELYNKMLESIAMHICGEMREHQDRLKRMMREASDQR